MSSATPTPVPSAPRPRRKRIVAVAVVAAFCIVLLTGCDDTSQALDFFMSWFSSQPTLEQAQNAAGRTGDDAVDGVLTSAQTLEDIRKADALALEANALSAGGLYSQADDLYAQAIALRPNDLRYRRARAMNALDMGDRSRALNEWTAMDGVAEGWSGAARMRYFRANIDDMDMIQSGLAYGTTYQGQEQLAAEEQTYALLVRQADIYRQMVEFLQANPDHGDLAEAQAETARLQALADDLGNRLGY